MSCWRKRRKRSVEQERAYQEQARKVALENGKRLGESPPPPSPSHPPIHNRSRCEFPGETLTGMCCSAADVVHWTQRGILAPVPAAGMVT